VGLRKIDHPGRYIDRGVERSWFYILVDHRILSQSIILSFSPSLFSSFVTSGLA